MTRITLIDPVNATTPTMGALVSRDVNFPTDLYEAPITERSRSLGEATR